MPKHKVTREECAGPFRFYNGTVLLWFEPKWHTYYKETEDARLVEVEGVTTAIHIIDKSNVLIPWAARQVSERILGTTPKEGDIFDGLNLKPIPFKEFEKIVETAKNLPKKILDDAGDIGSQAHKCLEDSIRLAIDTGNSRVTKLVNLPGDPRAMNCVNAALGWMNQHNVYWLETERKIYSRNWNYAGTMDGVALVSSCENLNCCSEKFTNVKAIIDWKSSNGLWLDYMLQAAAYQYAYWEETKENGSPATDRFILRLGKDDGAFEPWHFGKGTFKKHFDGFIACLNLYRLHKNLKYEMYRLKQGR